MPLEAARQAHFSMRKLQPACSVCNWIGQLEWGLQLMCGTILKCDGIDPIKIINSRNIQQKELIEGNDRMCCFSCWAAFFLLIETSRAHVNPKFVLAQPACWARIRKCMLCMLYPCWCDATSSLKLPGHRIHSTSLHCVEAYAWAGPKK